MYELRILIMPGANFAMAAKMRQRSRAPGQVMQAEVVPCGGPDAFKLRIDGVCEWEYLTVETMEESVYLAGMDLAKDSMRPVTWDGNGWRMVCVQA